VQHLYRQIGIDLAPGIHAKNTTPEDISATLVPHTRYVLDRDIGESKVRAKVHRVIARVKSKVPRAQA
jgi:hypothetical protein